MRRVSELKTGSRSAPRLRENGDDSCERRIRESRWRVRDRVDPVGGFSSFITPSRTTAIDDDVLERGAVRLSSMDLLFEYSDVFYKNL